MKTLSVNEGYHRVIYAFVDGAKADAAYAAIKTAINEYEEYGNRKDAKTVSIVMDAGEATIKLSAIASVVLVDEDSTCGEEMMRDRAGRQKKMQDIEAEAGLTPAKSTEA